MIRKVKNKAHKLKNGSKKPKINERTAEKVIARIKSRYGEEKPKSPHVNRLYEAMLRLEKATGTNLFDHLVDRALKSDTVLINVMKKLVPDLRQIEGNFSVNGEVNLSYMSDEEIDNALASIKDAIDK